ncbi:MAG TPA: 16S rRNA (guanine(527)-N(7))-methyltransferase RsmG [Bryobacteraceae bacterium]|nr:16S rRNA (guanine(527)-N(7))-methyltransferase RsmG [Bryobacteraceae bacterium]
MPAPDMSFGEELDRVLPADLPRRAAVVEIAARHLELIVEANRQFNLTRITGAREAAIKHVLDSVIPWERFSRARQVLDAGSGAGFPGIPLALVLPDVRFTLSESIGKKARFISAAARELGLKNVEVAGERAEEVLRSGRADIVTARAVAPMGRAGRLFGPALKRGTRALLYKGPDVASEIAEAEAELRSLHLQAAIVMHYELPDNAGSRTVVEMRAVGGG